MSSISPSRTGQRPVPPTERSRTAGPPRGGSTWRALGAAAALLFILVGVGVFVYVAAHFARQSAVPRSLPPPRRMADVDWRSPDSSVYCLSCHWTVGRAAAGLDVQRGHSLNKTLNEIQLRAVRDMGTIAGPGDTLICLSCHKLDLAAGGYMLADTLADSSLCQRCHPGHYARDTPHDLRQSAPDEKNRRGQTAAEGGPCSACHLAHRYAREIIPSPLDPDGYCVTCHQSYGVAAAHARRQVMHHPESHCLQCHNSHDATHGAFLKQATPELCLTCHADHDGGVARGMHPLVRMDEPVPQNLIDAGATAGADGHQLTCATCHSVHQAGHESLLVLPSRTNDLCVSCHADEVTAHAGDGRASHGSGPRLNGVQQAVVARWDGPMGAEGELLCVSCHRVHDAEPAASLLAFQPRYGDACIACHPDQSGIVGTPHDLTAKFPDAKNAAGLTPLAAGVCSACHMAHAFPRERVPGPGDQTGLCLSCHLAGRVAQGKTVGGIEHPDTQCNECHNPHARQNGRFLSEPEEALCGRCHADQLRLRGGPHDITQAQRPERWSTRARAHGGLCLSCHVPHGGDRPDLFRVAEGESVGNHDEVCLACHADTAWNAPQLGAIHPQHIRPDQRKVALALVPRDASGELRMGCRTCHEPHGGAKPVHLARVKPDEPTEALCLHCHDDKQYIRFTGHAPEKLSRLGMDTDSCKPCHAMHAPRDDTWGTMLSPRFLPRAGGNGSAAANAADAGQHADVVLCVVCHRPAGPAPFQKEASHPPRMLAQVGAGVDLKTLPLFNAQGHPDPQGDVVCRTCHVSHGRLDLLKLQADNPQWTQQQQHAQRAQLRPFVEPNTCTACHGAAGRALFLRFHDARARTKAPDTSGR